VLIVPIPGADRSDFGYGSLEAGVLPWHMETEDARQRAIRLIGELERHIQALEQLTGHSTEIASCKEAIENLKAILSGMQN